jgi:adenylate kinase
MTNNKLSINTIAMMGRPGSGKGYQANMLAESCNYKIISSGGYYRELATTDTYIGKRVAEMMGRGWLMPAWFSIYIFQDEAFKLEPEDGVIFEGPCRKLKEAELFHEVMEWLERPYKAVYLDIDIEVAKKRLIERSAEGGRADDSDIEKINLRFEEFERHTSHSITFFGEQGTLVSINGDQKPEVVHEDILKALGAK